MKYFVEKTCFTYQVYAHGRMKPVTTFINNPNMQIE